MQLFFFNKYLKGDVTERMESFHLLVHSPTPCGSQGWAGPKPRASSFIQVFYMGSRDNFFLLHIVICIDFRFWLPKFCFLTNFPGAETCIIEVLMKSGCCRSRYLIWYYSQFFSTGDVNSVYVGGLWNDGILLGVLHIMITTRGFPIHNWTSNASGFYSSPTC